MTHDLSPDVKRALISASITAQTGITEAMIDILVRDFYDQIRKDPLLGPIFTNRIKDWEPHLSQMVGFWSSVILMSGRYHGNPMAKHKDLAVDSTHFTRWLLLFEKSLRKICPPEAQAYFMDRARRIAQSLSMGIADMQAEAAAVPVFVKSGLVKTGVRP